MELRITYMKEGDVVTIPTRGTESRDEILYMIDKGLMADMEQYGMQFNVIDMSLKVRPSSIIRNLMDIPSTKNIIVSYVSSIFDMSEREVIVAASKDDVDFKSSIARYPLRSIPSIDTYPMLKTISSIPHVFIEKMASRRSTYDKRMLSLFREVGDRGEVVIMTDTLSLDGYSSLSNLREMITPGGILIITDTDYREDMKDILSFKIMVDEVAGYITSDTRFYKPRYQWHNILESEGLVHMYTEYMNNDFNNYISAYMFSDDIHLPLDRTYVIPQVMKNIVDIFPKTEGVLPIITINSNYNVDDLYSLDNPIYDDAHSIYTIIRKKSNSTPPIYIDGGGIGTMILAFSKYTKVHIRTDRVQEAMDNILLYKRGKIRRENTSYILTMGSREIVIGPSPPILPGSVVITTFPYREYKDSLYRIVRYNIGTRGMEGIRHDLKAETVYVVDAGIRTYPEREMLRLFIVGEIYKMFSQLVPGGDFKRYLFDIITIGQNKGVLLDPVIPATSSIVIPDSLIEMIVAIPPDWLSFVEMLKKNYPIYWEEHRKEIISILPFQSDRRKNIISRFREYIAASQVERISSSLHSFSLEQLSRYKDGEGKDIRIHTDVVNGIMTITPNTHLAEIIGKQVITFNVTPQMIDGRKYTDVASMLMRHYILDGAGYTSSVNAVELFGSPLLHMDTWKSIYPDIDTMWGSSGVWIDTISDIFVNPPYWNEAISSVITTSGSRKIYVPRVYIDKVRGMNVILV